MNTIIDFIYKYDKNLFLSNIYEPWISDLKKLANDNINKQKNIIDLYNTYEPINTYYKKT